MFLLDKKEKEMTKDETLKLEIMKTLAIGRGYNINDERLDFDFQKGSNFERMASAMLMKFNVTLKTSKKEKKEPDDIKENKSDPPPKKKTENK